MGALVTQSLFHFGYGRRHGSTLMPETTKKDEESDAKTQLERLVKDGEQIANKLPPFIPQRRRSG